MPDIDNKVVSISFNNKQFMRDVADTISVIEELNEATSGKKIDSSGIENLGRAFRNTTSDLTKQADSVVSAFGNIQSAANTNFQTAGIDSLRKALESTGMTATDVEDTISSLQQLSRTGLSYASDLGVSGAAQQIQNESANTRSILTQDIDDVSNSFSALEMIGIGAMIAIGEKAAEVGANALRSLTSGIRDGWGEYNALTNSTQTILVNTQRWGSTMEDVSGALEELNRYADMTTYSFSDMTRNIGYFTTAGVQLEDSVTAIRGLSNVGAMFGADAQSVARAGYQISQAMSAGVIKLMDWRSMINAGMGGQALQDELIRTAAVMSGTSVDAMNEYIDSLGGFNASLQEGWLTSDVFLEAMKVFAGQSREYYRSLTDENGERLYSDEEIDRLVALGETAMESATKVRTLQQMIDAFKESIGSGWQRTFTLIIGNLEEAKEFWTPINNILTSLVDGFFELQNSALSLWRTLGGREQLLEGINNVLTALSNNLGAIGRAFMNAFGNSTTMGSRLMGITEALTDFSESLILSEEELGFLEDFFTGIFEPISLVVDIIFELVKALFDADDSVLNLEHSADGLYSGFAQFRHALLAILGYIGSVLKTGANFIKQSRIIRTVVQSLVKIISKTFGGLVKIISAPFVALWQVWDKYNITERLDEFATKVAAFFLPLVDAISEVDEVISDWFDTFVDSISGTIKALDPIETLVQVFTSLKQLFRDLFDPTVSVSDAFSNFFNTMSTSNLAVIFEAIQSSFSDLWSALKETAIGQWFEDLGTRIQNGVAAFAETSFGQKIIEISNALRDFLGIDTTDWTLFWDATKLMLTDVADAIGTGWEKIKTFFTELVNIVKGWFGFADGEDGSVGESIDDMVGTADSSAMEDKIDTMEKTGGAIVSFMENTSKAVAMAEKLVPDPSESKFLTFMKELPEKIKEVGDSISDGSIIEKIGNFFSSFFTSVKSFFSSMSFGDGEDLLTWLADKARVIASIVGDFLGIQIVDLADKGVFGVLGAMVSAIVGWFGNLDLNLLDTVDRAAKTVSRVLTAIISLKIVSTISSLANAAQAGAKGWQAQQTAKKYSAMSDMLKSIAVMIVGVGAVIALLAIGLKNGYALEIVGAFAIIGGILIALFKGIQTIEKLAKDIKPGSLTGISKVLSKFGGLLLTIVISVVSVIGIAYLASKLIFNKNGGINFQFAASLVVVVGIFTVLTVATIVFISQMYHWANILYKADAQKAVNAVSDALKSISGLFISMIILLGGILASVAAFTYFINIIKENDAWDSLIIAAISVVAILVVAGLAIRFLIKTAQKMSSGIAGVKPSDFKQIMMIMSGLLVTVMASIVVLIMAVTSFVSMMTTTGATADQMWTAALIVGGLLLAVFGGLKWLFDSLKGIAELQKRNVWSSFFVVIFTMATLTGLVAVLITYATNLSNSLSDVKNLWHTMGAMGTALLGLILGVIAIVLIINEMPNISEDTWKALGAIAASMGIMVIALIGISHAISKLVIALGSSGFNGNINDVVGSLMALLIIASTVMGLMAWFVKQDIIDTKSILTAALTLAITAGVMIIIADALSKIMTAISKGGALIESAITLGLLFAAIVGALGIISGIAQADVAGVIVAALAIAATSASLTIIAAALAIIANIPVEQIQKSGFVLGALFVVMSLVLGILTGIAATGAGAGFMAIAAIIILALATSFLILGSAVEKAGIGFNLMVGALERFTEAFNNLNNLNVQGVSNKFISILNTLKFMAREFLTLAPTIGNILETVLKAIGKGISYGFAAGIGEGLLALAEFIMNNAPTIVNAFAYLGQLILTAAHALMVSLKDIIVADFGPGGTVREIATAIADFVAWLAGNVSEWAMDIIDSFITGLATALSDQTRIERITTGIQILWLTIKKAFMDDLGFPNLQAFGASIVLKIMEGVTDYLAHVVDTIAAHPGLQALLNYLDLDPAEALSSFSDIADAAGNMASGDVWDSTSVGNQIASLTERLNELRDASENAESSLGDLSSAPIDLGSIFSGNILGSFDLSNLGSIATAISSITGAISSSNGGGSILSSILGGFGSGALEGISEFINENGGVSNLLGGILGSSGITDMLSSSDFLSPTITPVVDTSEVSLGINNIADMFNNANIDEFAIDAGNSMLIREAAEGDAANSGGVSYNFTQINNSPEALSPIQIYRDTNNLFRGVINT